MTISGLVEVEPDFEHPVTQQTGRHLHRDAMESFNSPQNVGHSSVKSEQSLQEPQDRERFPLQATGTPCEPIRKP
jgi:hypothetical protein